MFLCLALWIWEGRGLQTPFYHWVDGVLIFLCAFACFHAQEVLIIGAQNEEEFSAFLLEADSSGCWSLCTSVRLVVERQNPTEKTGPFN